MTKQATVADEVRVGLEFMEILKSWLTADEWTEMRAKNATAEYQGGVCASHDYCDANMAMHEAFVKCGLVPPCEIDTTASEAAERLADDVLDTWNKAWDWARANGLEAETYAANSGAFTATLVGSGDGVATLRRLDTGIKFKITEGELRRCYARA